MSIVIYINNSKGGVSKTTTTVNLARAIQVLTGELPALIDSDPSKGLTKLLRTSELGWCCSHVSDSDDLRESINRASESPYIIIDGGAQISGVTMMCLKAADLILILVQPSPLDLAQTADYLDLVTDKLAVSPNKRAAFVLSLHDSTNITKAVHSLLSKHDLPVVSGLSRKGAFKDSLASGVTVFEPYKDQFTDTKKKAKKAVKDECLALAKEVFKLSGVNSLELTR